MSAQAFTYGQYGIKNASQSGSSFSPANQPQLVSPANSMTTPFSGWSVPFGSLTSVTNFGNGTPFASKHAEMQSLLTAMGRSGVTYAYGDFYIYELTIPSGREGNYAGPYHQIPLVYNGIYTVAAWVKLISGNPMTHNYCNGYNTGTGGWQLCGDYNYGTSVNYSYFHPYGAAGNSACVMRFALPGCVAGYVDVNEPLAWMTFLNSNMGQG